MREQVIERLQNRFNAYADLADTLTDELLNETVDVPKHKTLAQHLWCVIGARESYARAIEQGEWDGFACSLTSYSPSDFAHKLRESAQRVQTVLADVGDWSEVRLELLATLAEHEVMHEGQIIRHVYALEQALPDSWAWA